MSDLFDDDLFGNDGSISDARDGFVTMEDLVDRLLLVNPDGAGTRESTIKGNTSTYTFVSTDTFVLDGETTDLIQSIPAHLEAFQFVGARITPILEAKLRKADRSKRWVLGRIQKGKAQRGQSAPWVWIEPTEKDKAMAAAFMAAQRRQREQEDADAFG